MKKIFVYNPKSGSALSKAELKARTLRHGITIDVWLPIGERFTRQLTMHVQKQCLVYVLGGDGTISSVASIITHTRSILIPLPGGTLNHFSKDLGMPQDLDTALSALKNYRDCMIDIASVNETYFINNSSIGIYAKSLEVRENLKGTLPKWPAALLANLHVLLRFKRYRMTIDGVTIRSPILFVGNNKYSFTFGKLGTRNSLMKGVLTLAVTHAFTRRETILTALRVLIGKGPEQKQLEVSYPEHVTIAMKKSHMTVSHDGEMSRLQTPLRYTLHKNALRVRLPFSGKESKK